MDWYNDMIQFHLEVMEDTIPTYPQIPDDKCKTLRIALITEEVGETLKAIEEDDIVEIADGIADSIVVLLGTAVMYGIDIRPIFQEVHENNMTKKDGPMSPTGKRLKPANWQPPRIRELLLKQGMLEAI